MADLIAITLPTAFGLLVVLACLEVAERTASAMAGTAVTAETSVASSRLGRSDRSSPNAWARPA